MTKARVVLFVGERSAYGAAHLRPLLEHFDVIGLVWADDARWRRFQEQVHGPVRAGWRPRRKSSPKLDIPSSLPQWRVNDVHQADLLVELRRLRPEYCISAAYPQIFRRPVLELAPGGVINFHPSVLPAFRGAHPHFWTIAKNATESGVTAHQMTEAIDEGDIYVQRSFPISEWTYSELYQRLLAETPLLVDDLARAIRENKPLVPQEAAKASLYFGDRDLDHRLAWETARVSELRALVRTHRAFTTWRGRRFGVQEAEDAGVRKGFLAGRPGVVLALEPGGPVVAAVDGSLRLKVVRWAGVSWSGARAARWAGLRVGDGLV